jgi:hypothetical protein
MLAVAALAAAPLCATWAQEPPPAAEPAAEPATTVAAPENRPQIVWTTRNPAGFIAMTPGKAMFAVAGTMAMLGAGDMIVKENLMTEPAGALSRDLARVVAERTGGVVRSEPTPATGLKPEDIAAGAKDARYVVDVTTMGWSYIYQPLKWTSFNANYYARLQLIDATTGKLLLKDVCAWPKKGEAQFVSQEALLADHAQELKRQIMKGTLACRSQFVSKMEALKL